MALALGKVLRPQVHTHTHTEAQAHTQAERDIDCISTKRT